MQGRLEEADRVFEFVQTGTGGAAAAAGAAVAVVAAGDGRTGARTAGARDATRVRSSRAT